MQNKNIRQKLVDGFTFVKHEATIFTVYIYIMDMKEEEEKGELRSFRLLVVLQHNLISDSDEWCQIVRKWIRMQQTSLISIVKDITFRHLPTHTHRNEYILF